MRNKLDRQVIGFLTYVAGGLVVLEGETGVVIVGLGHCSLGRTVALGTHFAVLFLPESWSLALAATSLSRPSAPLVNLNAIAGAIRGPRASFRSVEQDQLSQISLDPECCQIS